jgi:hypothetical protein
VSTGPIAVRALLAASGMRITPSLVVLLERQIDPPFSADLETAYLTHASPIEELIALELLLGDAGVPESSHYTESIAVLLGLTGSYVRGFALGWNGSALTCLGRRRTDEETGLGYYDGCRCRLMSGGCTDELAHRPIPAEASVGFDRIFGGTED